MAYFSQRELRELARVHTGQLANSITEARRLHLKTAFLCHSHLDRELVRGVVQRLRRAGWDVYVDWADDSMPASPNRETAAKIKDRIVACDYFLFLATANSMASRWCPWEVGYADGKKSIDQILLIPTTDDQGRFHGNEYLQLYRRIMLADDGDVAAFNPGETLGVYARQL